jgi:uncharacterized membrane protein YdjX (TVP38/TMEM64 family)
MRQSWAAIALAALAIFVAGYVALQIGPGGSVSRIDQALEAIRKLGTSGWLGLVVLQIVVAVSGVLPASLVGIAAGTLYGPWIGFCLAATGTFLGAILSFWFSRSLFRPWVERLLRRRPQALGFDAALGQDGWKLVCLLRVSPVMPFVATSYALGLSSVSWRDYTGGTLATLPALFGYVMLGTFAKASLAAPDGDAERLRWVLLGAGSVAAIVLTAYVCRIAARAIRAGP